MSEQTTGSFRALTDKLNGHKKSAAISAASIGIVVAVMQMFPNTVPGYTEGQILAADVERIKDKTDSILVVTERVSSMEKSITEFKQEVRQESHETQILVRQLLAAQGIRPAVPESIGKVDTVWMEIVTEPVDTSKTRPR